MKQRLIRFGVKLRRTMPPWFDRWLTRVLASDSAVARHLKGVLAANEPIPEPVLPDTWADRRLLIAPFNYAGQGFRWAESVNDRASGVSARNIALTSGTMTFPAHLTVPSTVFLGSSEWKERFNGSLDHYTHVIIESFGSLFGNGTGPVVLDEIRQLRERGIKVGLLCHGSDIRSPTAFVARNPSVRLKDFGEGVGRLQRAADSGAEVLEQFDGEVFVSTPDLLNDVPGATLLPVVVDPHPWAQAAAEISSREGPPLVVHAPSHTGVKGTIHVDRVAKRLHAEGVIEYRRLTGIPPKDMPAVYAEADIVVDQMLLGLYGVAACEAMAASKPVVSNVFDEVRDAVFDLTGWRVPIVQADPTSLELVLRELASAPARRRDVGEASARFVNAVHDGSQTLPALSRFLGLTLEASTSAE